MDVGVDPVNVLIIGGGIQGTSVAAHLAEKGANGVYVIDGNPGFGQGTTQRSAAMIMGNIHTGDEALMRLSARGLSGYSKFKDKYGADPGFVRCGSLLLATTDEVARGLKEQARLQNSHGIKTKLLNREDVRRLVPELNASAVLAGLYSPGDGFINAASVVEGYRNYAEAKGVRFMPRTKATGINVKDGKMASVQIGKETIPVRRVVNAAGASASEVASWADVSLPLENSTRTLWEVTTRNDIKQMPIVEILDGEYKGYYLRRRHEGSELMIGVGPTDIFTDELGDPGRYLKPTRKDETIKFLSTWFPDIERIGEMRGWSGIRTLSPDERPIVGPATGVEGFVLCCGPSGYGITHAPATGFLTATYLQEGAVRREMEGLSASPERWPARHGIEQ